jgi:hypothetical protein
VGGSGGGSGDYSRDEAKINELRREVQQQLRQQELDADLNEFLGQQLANLNDRDTHLTQARLIAVEEALGDAALEVDRLLFGGSVAKHTYVDGLSDVDALVVLNAPGASPADLIGQFEQILRGRLAGSEVLAVNAGHLAVTITYQDGSQMQLLPAVERDGHTAIASESGSSWRFIRPHKFAEKLTEVNRSNGGSVVPTIKLAKAVLGGLPENQRLSGYHIEAIAIDAFRDYSGRRDRVSMLKHLVAHTSEAVLRPTGDITGQSVHIDSQLGTAGSAQRQAISASIGRIFQRLDGASSVSDYRVLFDE